MSRRPFLLSSDNSCGTHLLSFYTFPIIYKCTEIARWIMPSCSADFFSICAEFISSSACNSSVSIFWGRPARGSSSRLKSSWRNSWYYILHVIWLTAFFPYVAQISAVVSTAFFFRWNAKWIDNRICSFVIAIMKTTEFWGYVYQRSNFMAYYKAKCQRFKTAKGRKDFCTSNITNVKCSRISVKTNNQ